MEREDLEVDAVPGLVLRERRIQRPARLSRAPVGEEAEHEDRPAEHEEPVGKRVQAGERDVARADHQRHEVVPEAGEDGDDDEEDHRRAVDRDELVVVLGAQDARVRLRELEAEDERHEPGEDEEDERGRDVEDPDPLVVRRDEPARDLAALPGRCRFGSSCHSAGSPSGTSRAPAPARPSSPSRPPASCGGRSGRGSRAPPGRMSVGEPAMRGPMPPSPFMPWHLAHTPVHSSLPSSRRSGSSARCGAGRARQRTRRST